MYISSWGQSIALRICLLTECLSTELLTLAAYPILLIRFWLIVLTPLMVHILTLVAFNQGLPQIPFGACLADPEIAIWVKGCLDLLCLFLLFPDEGMDFRKILPGCQVGRCFMESLNKC